MAREYTFICDGCEGQAKNRSGALPSSWADVSIEIVGFTNWQAGGGKELRTDSLLCPSCQIALQNQSCPKRWIRRTSPALRGTAEEWAGADIVVTTSGKVLKSRDAELCVLVVED